MAQLHHQAEVLRPLSRDPASSRATTPSFEAFRVEGYRVRGREEGMVMGYLLRGLGAGTCHCQRFCPCNLDEVPNGPGDQCKGWFVIQIREGNRDKVDLSGVTTAMVYEIPGRPSSGGWRVGVVIDSGASDE